MYLHSDDLREIEARARKMRAEAMKNFFISLFSRFHVTTPNVGKTA